ncbi:Ral GTPase-activating protein subunit alpha-1 [Actinomortierella wolfii]|nr:Ral GTPase-activating protein subunit alpha-1 [Actinomortierella wolfii]
MELSQHPLHPTEQGEESTERPPLSINTRQSHRSLTHSTATTTTTTSAGIGFVTTTVMTETIVDDEPVPEASTGHGEQHIRSVGSTVSTSVGPLETAVLPALQAHNSDTLLTTELPTLATSASKPSPVSNAPSVDPHHPIAQSFQTSSAAAAHSHPPPAHPPTLASLAAARLSQAFSPLLANRRRSQALDPPPTPDTVSSFYAQSSYANSPTGSLSNSEGLATVSGLSDLPPQPTSSHLPGIQLGASPSATSAPGSLGKGLLFSSPRSHTRVRKPLTILADSHLPSDENTSPSYTAPPNTATAFHAGLAPHFLASSNASKAPATSTAGSAMLEKALKKAKIFLDERAKPKARATSLWSFLDVTFEHDQVRFFQDHAEQVFTVTHDTFWHQVGKLKQKNERSLTLQSKEVTSIQKNLLILRLIFLYLPERIKNGWHRRAIARILSQVLAHKNHPRIRIFGFRLLLLWLNDQTQEYPEAMHLFSNAISLELFAFDGEDLSIDQASSSQTKLPFLSSGSSGRRSTRVTSQYVEMAAMKLHQETLLAEGPLICPNPAQPAFQDGIQLLQIFLANIVRLAYVAAGSLPPRDELASINSHFPLETDGEAGDGIAVGFGIDAGLAAARFMFEIIKKHYLVKVFPECARRLNLLKGESEGFGFKTCPPTILRTVISFIIQFCLDSNDYNSPLAHTSPATPILKSIVYSSEVNREMVHEIVRQGLTLPAGHPQYKDILRGAVHIIGVWCLSSEEERPSFLRSSSGRHAGFTTSLSSLQAQDGTAQGTTSASSSSSSLATAVGDGYQTANSYLRRYFKWLTDVFYDKPTHYYDSTSNRSSDALNSGGYQVKLDAEALGSQYKDVIGLFRAIMTRSQIEMDNATWSALLDSLLTIYQRLLAQPIKYATPISTAQTDELAVYITETLLFAFSSCPQVQSSHWLALRECMTKTSIVWPQVVSVWGRWTTKLTGMVALEIYGVDVEAQAQRAQQQASIGRSGRKIAQSIPGMSTIYTPSMLGHMGLLGGRENPRPYHPVLKPELEESEEDDESSESSMHRVLAEPAEVGDDKLSRTSSVSFHAPDSLHLDPLVERLSPFLGQFSSLDGWNLSLAGRSASSSLTLWKNLMCIMGNPNDIDDLSLRAEVFQSIIDATGIMNAAKVYLPLEASISPSAYDFLPWLLQAAEIGGPPPSNLPAIYSCLCRVMCRRYDGSLHSKYYDRFYRCIMKGLGSENANIEYPILAFCSKIFSYALPGSDCLILSFLEAIRRMLLCDGQLQEGANHFIRRQAIALLASICSKFYIPQCENSVPRNDKGSSCDILSLKPVFIQLVLDLTTAESTAKPLGKFWDTHSMLLQLCGSIVVHKWREGLDSDEAVESKCLTAVLDHLYWSETIVVESAVQVLSTLALCYKEHGSKDDELLHSVLSNILSSLEEHLRVFKSEVRKAANIVALYRCLVEWLAILPAKYISESHLVRWIFELIESSYLTPSASQVTVSTPRPDATGHNREHTFPLSWPSQAEHDTKSGRRHHGSIRTTGKKLRHYYSTLTSSPTSANNQAEEQLVKDVAEATLNRIIHFLAQFPEKQANNMLQGFQQGASTELDTALALRDGLKSAGDKDGSEAQLAGGKSRNTESLFNVFALNEKTLVSIVERRQFGSSELPKVQVIVRNETGRYAWDAEVFYKAVTSGRANHRKSAAFSDRPSSRYSQYLSQLSFIPQRRPKDQMTEQLLWRDDVHVREDVVSTQDETTSNGSNGSNSHYSKASTSRSTPTGPSGPVPLPEWDPDASQGGVDMMDQLLQYIGSTHTDCLFDGKTPLNALNNGLTLSPESKRISVIDTELDRHVQEENYYSRISDPQARAWFDKLVELRSSLIYVDEDEEEYPNSNNLMTLIHSTWDKDPFVESFNGSASPGATDSESAAKRPQDSANTTASASPQEPNQPSSMPPYDDKSMAKSFQVVLPPEAEYPLSPFMQCRLLLGHLGLFDYERFRGNHLVLLNPSPALARDLTNLDKKSGRDTYKMALLYVAPGQEGEQTILMNQKGSYLYERLVASLGKEVHLADHSGYLGGLERNGSNGKTAIYFCSSTVEIMFHDATRMPTDYTDPRQMKKKRHIGNDHVHIIWSEHYRPYDRTTIGGDFGNVLIVLTPLCGRVGMTDLEDGADVDLDNILVAVEVIRDTNIPVFGPLLDGMVLPFSQLGPLVRQTAIHGAQAALAPPMLSPSVSSTIPLSNTPSPGLASAGSNMTTSNSAQASTNATTTTTGSTKPIQTMSAPITIGHSLLSFGTGAAGPSSASSGSTSSASTSIAGPQSAKLPSLSIGTNLQPEPGHQESTGVATPASLENAAAETSTLNSAHLPSVDMLPSSQTGESSGVGLSNQTVPSTPGGPLRSASPCPPPPPPPPPPSTQPHNTSASLQATTNALLGLSGTLGTSRASVTGGPGLTHFKSGHLSGGGPASSSASSSSSTPPSGLAHASGASSTTGGSAGSSTVSHGPSHSLPSFLSPSMPLLSQPNPFKQRATAIEQIIKRHKLERWSYHQFLEHVFGHSKTGVHHGRD